MRRVGNLYTPAAHSSSSGIETNMANPAKRKGDINELKAVSFLVETAPELVSVKKPMRKLGAGRSDDEGDLSVYSDCAIQVRAVDNLGTALRSAARDAKVQAANAFQEYGLGMVPIPRARQGTVQWLATTLIDEWPAQVDPVATFKQVSKAVEWLRDDVGPHGYMQHDRIDRICILEGGDELILIAPIDAWIYDYAPFSAAAKARELQAA